MQLQPLSCFLGSIKMVQGLGFGVCITLFFRGFVNLKFVVKVEGFKRQQLEKVFLCKLEVRRT